MTRSRLAVRGAAVAIVGVIIVIGELQATLSWHHRLPRQAKTVIVSGNSSVVATAYLISSTTLSNGSVRTVTILDTATSTATAGSNPCVIVGQPAGVLLKIASDIIGNPVAGAQVSATHREANDTCNGVLYPGIQTTVSFTTNGTAWYSLDSTNAGTYSFAVRYSDRNYNFTAQLEPMTLTCTTLYVPSGLTHTTKSDTATCR
jgi:hypothetical protein